MSDLPLNLPGIAATGTRLSAPAEGEANRYTEAALERHKREGLSLAVKARWVALSVVGVMLPFLNPSWEMVYYYPFLVMLALVGWAQQRIGRVGRSRAELALLFVDLAVLTFILAFPNPISVEEWPAGIAYIFGNFVYFYIFLAAGTLAYSWRTILTIGTVATLLWLSAAVWAWQFGVTVPAITDGLGTVFADQPRVAELLDPNSVHFDRRIQEVVVFMIVAGTLALSVRRFNGLLLGNAALERERANLSRYFSPNVVDELSRNDEPLKQIRTHDVAVLFVDIVGFTTYAAKRPPREVITTLRSFHSRMETEVFRHGGTLDKYMGDGLMATFGTPRPGAQDAANALNCARAMLGSVTEWNAERRANGQPELRASFGLHYGPVVLGDIGANRLEFAVIGNTVNVASRLESMTRALAVPMVISDPMRDRVLSEVGHLAPCLVDLTRQAPQPVRGLDQPMPVWTLNGEAA